MRVDTTYRSTDIEIMDDLDMSGDVLIKTLNQIAGINKWLGGNGLTLDGIKTLLKSQSRDRTIRIVDLGCGNGDMLREVAEFGKKRGYTFELLGIDANQATLDHAIQLSAGFPEISYQKEDVLSEAFETRTYDIALCTLFLHHFDDDTALLFIQKIVERAKIGVVVNDLHRHKLAYYLFKMLTSVMNNPMVRTDGLISILKGFKRIDLEQFSQKINHKSTITWRWAFRYQWIISKA